MACSCRKAALTWLAKVQKASRLSFERDLVFTSHSRVHDRATVKY
jgi:hypothetical protein